MWQGVRVEGVSVEGERKGRGRESEEREREREREINSPSRPTTGAAFSNLGLNLYWINENNFSIT